MDTEILALAHELQNMVYTVEYKLPRQRTWRYGYSMKSIAGIDASIKTWKAGLAVDNLCLSTQIKTRIV